MADLKIFVTDYTKFPEKVLITDRRGQAAETSRCPVCGKIGLIENRDGKISYFHRLGYEFIPDEQYPTILDETCNLPTNTEKK
jgi:hypothetical protein